MPTKQPILLVCFLLTGILLDAQWTWYSHHFNSACEESGSRLIAPWPSFTVLTLLPAGTSLIFHANRGNFVVCLGIWLCQILLQCFMIAESNWFEGHTGINCYKRIGSGAFASFILATLFTATIFATTPGFATVHFARKLLGQAPKVAQPSDQMNPGTSRYVENEPIDP